MTRIQAGMLALVFIGIMIAMTAVRYSLGEPQAVWLVGMIFGG